jgi:hypothetical protein
MKEKISNFSKVKRAIASLSPRGKDKKRGKVADISLEKEKAKRTVDGATKRSSSSAEFQPVKLKSSDSSDKYASINKANREIFYGDLLCILKKYPLMEDGEGGLDFSVPEGKSRKIMKNEMVTFVKAEIDKLGFRYRWPEPVFMAISRLGMAARRNDVRVEDWAKFSGFFQEDQDFNAWKAEKTAIENSSEFQQVQPASPRSPKLQERKSPHSRKNDTGGDIKSPRSSKKISLALTTPEQKKQLSEWFDKSNYDPLELDQALLRFVDVFMASHPDFPVDVLSDFIIRKVREHNKSTRENVNQKHALAAVKNYFSQSPRPSAGLGGKLSDYGSILNPMNVKPPSTGFGQSGSFMASTTKATDGPVNIVPMTPLELNPYSGGVMQPFTGLQSISAQASPGRSNYLPNMNQQSIQPYPQDAQDSGYYLHKEGFTGNQAAPSTNEPTLFERIDAEYKPD